MYRVTRFVNKNDTGPAPKLESVLANLDGERAINTVEKTSRDWDDFKIREGIDDDLTQQAKDGYLERQEFLQRVDVRTYEKEREERVAGRAAAFSANAPK